MSSSSQTLESMLVCTKSTQQEKKPRPAEQALKCPRCDSTNTKFCYYNNYSLSQPRYFCKSCRRYWTKGGTLRNVPVGGGCRKNKRSSSSSSSSSSNSKKIHEHHHHHDQAIATTRTSTTTVPTPLLPLSYDSDISLAIARFQKQFQQQGFDDNNNNNSNNNLSMLGGTSTNLDHILGNHGGFDALKGGFLESSSSSYYGMMNNGNENGGNLGIGIGIGIHGGDEMGLPYEDLMQQGATAGGVKQEGHESNNRVLWGFPWQFSSGGGPTGGNEGNLGDLDPGRQSWNTSWHGLLNSPLM